MLLVVDAIYRMVGSMVKLPPDEDTPEKRVTKIFKIMEKVGEDVGCILRLKLSHLTNIACRFSFKDLRREISLPEFKDGSRRDASIVNSLNLYEGLV